MPAYVRTTGVRRLPIAHARLNALATRMLDALREEPALGVTRATELSVVLCDDATIHALNREYRGRDAATDVLAFAMREGEGAAHAGELLGDVVISVDRARAQAAERGWAIASEIAFLLAHGLLHLVGFDHRDDDEERLMRDRTVALVGAAAGARAARDVVEKHPTAVDNRTRSGRREVDNHK